MSLKERLKAAPAIQGRLPWMVKGDAGVISVRVEGGNTDAAADVLEHHAEQRGLKIAELTRFTKDGVDAVFARGEPR